MKRRRVCFPMKTGDFLRKKNTSSHTIVCEEVKNWAERIMIIGTTSKPGQRHGTHEIILKKYCFTLSLYIFICCKNVRIDLMQCVQF